MTNKTVQENTQTKYNYSKQRTQNTALRNKTSLIQSPYELRHSAGKRDGLILQRFRAQTW